MSAPCVPRSSSPSLPPLPPSTNPAHHPSVSPPCRCHPHLRHWDGLRTPPPAPSSLPVRLGTPHRSVPTGNIPVPPAALPRRVSPAGPPPSAAGAFAAAAVVTVVVAAVVAAVIAAVIAAVVPGAAAAAASCGGGGGGGGSRGGRRNGGRGGGGARHRSRAPL